MKGMHSKWAALTAGLILMTAVFTGSAFGAEGCVRISFATSMANLTKALERIQRVVAR